MRVVSIAKLAKAPGHRVIGLWKAGHVRKPEPMEKLWNTDRSPAFAMKRLGHAQLGAVEGAMLYYLARDHFSGTGNIVELGAFLGASASLLGKGVSENPKWDGMPKIYSHDVFEATMQNMAEFVQARIDPNFKHGQSFLPYFQAQTAEVADTITICKGDLLTATWKDGPIEILFVDVAKSPALNEAVFKTFFTALAPNGGMLIHQDFHNPANPWIHTSMGYLDSHFDILEARADDSSLFQLKDMPSDAKIAEACAYGTLSLSEKISRIDRVIDWFEASEENGARYLHLSKANMMIHAGETASARALIEDTRTRVGVIEDKLADFFWDSRCDALLAKCD